MSRTETGSIAVVGAGVVGLYAAMHLLERGHRVSLYFREPTARTTSAVAAAFWLPYKVGDERRVFEWALWTRDHYRELSRRGVPGVTFARLLILTNEGEGGLDEYSWLPDTMPARPEELDGGFSAGIALEVPLVETPLFLPWLEGEVRRMGAEFLGGELTTLDEFAGRHACIVNCSGVGARTLTPDPAVYPIRGRVLRVGRPAGLASTIIVHDVDDETTYIVPRSSDVILGGTADAGEWEVSPDEQIGREIFARCCRLSPQLAGSTILEQKAGLRPGRPKIRFELERRSNGLAVIHNYGHGGAGYTLAPACAEQAGRLVDSL